ncbi:MAG: hypothetical protein ACOCU6_00170 [Nanoarchaeota archaeon]
MRTSKPNKKGMLSLMMLVDILVAAMVVLIFIGIHQVMTDKDQIENMVMARDVATLIDTMQTTDKDVTYLYPESFYEKDFFINKSQLLVTNNFIGEASEQASMLRYLTQYPIHRSKYFHLDDNEHLEGARLYLLKKNNIITINPENEQLSEEKHEEISSWTREELILTVAAGDQKNSFISDMVGKLRSQLEIEEFRIKDPCQYVDMIIMINESTKVDRVTIYYERTNKDKTEIISEKIRYYLAKSKNVPVAKEVMEYEHPENDASIRILIPQKEDVRTTLKSSDEFDMFIERIVYAMKEYYPEK